MNGIPTLVLDASGAMGGLLLRFPSLTPADFEPWLDQFGRVDQVDGAVAGEL